MLCRERRDAWTCSVLGGKGETALVSPASSDRWRMRKWKRTTRSVQHLLDEPDLFLTLPRNVQPPVDERLCLP